MSSATPTIQTSATAVQTAQEFVDFINKSPSPFHAVLELSKTLKEAGFVQLNEKDSWKEKIAAGGKYFVTRNQSAIIAFAVGGKYEAGNGFHVIGAHTDSPCLKIKPVSKSSSNGWLQVGVETYGGGLFNTWFDRDLGIAGRVLIETENGVESRFVLIDRPIMRIPTLAIHLDREIGTKGFQFNKENHLRPVLATAVKEQLEKVEKCADGTEKHHPILLNLLAKELNVTVGQISDFELCLFDHHKAAIGGILNEFVFAPRLDNLCCSWVSTEALVKSLPTLDNEESVRMVACFDNEEIGSNSLMGAASTFLEQVMKRVEQNSSNAAYDQEKHMIAIRKSIFISADMAHAVHPNYSEKHEAQHRPKLHQGCVIKYNANERYATSGESASLLKKIAKKNNIEVQDFVIRQDMGCGSTIGPIIATSTGIRTLDVGIAQLSMHSIREMCGTEDLEKTRNWFEAVFNEFTALDKVCNTD